MKIKKSHLIIAAVVVAIAIAIVAKLKSNRAEYTKEIAVAQRKVDKVAVSIDTVKTGVISQNITASGVLEAAETLTLVSETQGKIVKIYKEKGNSVSVGEVILKVDDEVISANVLTAEANFLQFEKDYDRLSRLAQENAVTKRDLEQTAIGLKKAKADLISARKALSNTSIKAPIAGYINADFVTEGQLLGGGSQVCEIVNNNILKLNIKITEREVYKIKLGQAVAINITAFPDKKFTGTISSIAEKADAAMKFNIEITLTNSKEVHLRSGLYAEAELPVKSAPRMIIRKTAIVGSMEKPVVYIAVNGKAEKRAIVLGQNNTDYAEVLTGLNVGEQLIVSGQLNIKNGDEIKIVE